MVAAASAVMVAILVDVVGVVVDAAAAGVEMCGQPGLLCEVSVIARATQQ